jgi:sigma-B regulation protein RsbU (phosphoserine phosphatase)
MSEHLKSLKLAGEIQKTLMPQSSPAVVGLDIAGVSQPCEEIGGDYFDYIEAGDGQPLLVAVGDLTGHGVDAALLMTTARAFLRMRAQQPGDLAAIVTDLNRHLTSDTQQSNRFMTLLLMAIDPAAAVVEWVRAGHDPAILYDPDQDRFEDLRGPGLALGLNEAVRYTSVRHSGLKTGQIIAIATDGLWEARNTHGEMWGKVRFQDAIRDNAEETSASIVRHVFDRLKKFTLGTLPEDDKTLVIIKLTPSLTVPAS